MAAKVPHGYAGKILRVKLDTEEISEDVLDEATLRKYVGGTGIGAKYLCEEVPAGVEWSDPANLLFLGSGPLSGTTVPGSGTFSVVTKGPLTDGAVATQANGFFGAYLRFSGYDGVIVQGAAKRWVYLVIRDGTAELREAAHLLGKDTWETQDVIQQELGVRPGGLSVACVGPAGEHLVKFAAICADHGHIAGHNGTGAVMGSKKLKAIVALRGKSRVALADGRKLNQLQRELFETVTMKRGGGNIYNWGTLSIYKGIEARGLLPIRNYTTSVHPDRENLERFDGEYIRGNFDPEAHPCWACRMHHCHHMKVPRGKYAGWIIEEPEYEGLSAWGALTGPTEVEEAAVLADTVDRLGMDTNEAGWLIGMTMECYEKGLLTKEDTDGLEMSWGNAEAARLMLHKVARREGFGDTLAEGVKRASERIGGAAKEMAIYTRKGNSPRGHDHRATWAEMFDTAISNSGTIETGRSSDLADLGLLPTTDDFDPVQVSSIAATTKGTMQFEDSLGVCRFITGMQMRWLIQMVNAATGWDFSLGEAWDAGRRAVNMLRVFNLRHGHTAELDGLPSARYCSVPVDGPAQGKDIKPHWENMVRNYYELMGWDKEVGKPLPYTLRRLGLEDYVSEVWAKEKRG